MSIESTVFAGRLKTCLKVQVTSPAFSHKRRLYYFITFALYIFYLFIYHLEYVCGRVGVVVFPVRERLDEVRSTVGV